MFQVQTNDGRTVATADDYFVALAIQTAEQKLWHVALFVVRTEA